MRTGTIGDLRHRVELQSVTSTPDGMGGTTDVWGTVVTVWAAIWPVPAMEQIRAGAPTMIGTHRLRIRHYGGLNPSWRVKFGDRYFSIVSIVNQNERDEVQELLCKEVL